MFEGSYEARAGHLQRQTRVANGYAQDAAASAWSWKQEAERLAAYALSLEGRIASQETRIRNMQGELNVANAMIDGREAQLNEIEKLHANSPLLQDSEQSFANGKVKTRLRLVFEKTFDATLRGIGVTNPEAYRAP